MNIHLRKFSKCIYLFSLNRIFRTFELRSKVLSLGNEKKNKFSFCISLAYSYLCKKKIRQLC